MTATIVPNTDLVTRSDVALRLQDYKRSIDFYLEATELPIFFLENSGFDFDSDADFRRYTDTDRIHIRRFSPHPDTLKGKGFQEFYLLDQFFNSTDAAGFVAKISGRYIVANIRQLLQPKKDLHIDLHRKKQVAITGFFTVHTDFYKHVLQGLYAQANDAAHRYIEHVLYDELIRESHRKSVDILAHNAQYFGVSGSHGGSMARNRYKMLLREAERQVMKAAGIREFLVEY